MALFDNEVFTLSQRTLQSDVKVIKDVVCNSEISYHHQSR